jgi:hypothetical protein
MLMVTSVPHKMGVITRMAEYVLGKDVSSRQATRQEGLPEIAGRKKYFVLG